jgi:drug/metabolite transporter (DMT)-like permease
MAALAWLVLSVVWGLTWLAVRIGLDEIPPITFAGIRFLIAAVVLGAVLVVRRVPLPRSSRDWRLLTFTGLLTIGIAYSAQFWGQQYVSSGLTAVMFSTVPLFALMFAHIGLPGEPITKGKLAGALLGLVGVAVIFSDQLETESTLAVWGCLAFVLGSATMALAQVLIKARGTHIDPLLIASYQMTIGGSTLLLVGIAVEGGPVGVSWTPSAIASLAYLSLFGSALAFFLFYWLLRHMQVTKVMSMALVHPLVAVMAGAIVLGETLSWRVAIGATAILGGLAMILPGAQVGLAPDSKTSSPVN